MISVVPAPVYVTRRAGSLNKFSSYSATSASKPRNATSAASSGSTMRSTTKLVLSQRPNGQQFVTLADSWGSRLSSSFRRFGLGLGHAEDQGANGIAREPNFRSFHAVGAATPPERDQPPKHFLLRTFYDIITIMSVVCPRSTVWDARPGVPVAIVEWSNRPRGSRMRFRLRSARISRNHRQMNQFPAHIRRRPLRPSCGS